MEQVPKIKLPVALKITNKLNTLSKVGSEQILDFVAKEEIRSMFYLYLFKKYKSNCFIHSKNLLGKGIGMTLRLSSNQVVEKELDIVSELLVDCISKLETKIVIVPINFFGYSETKKDSAHANVLIYRKKFNQIEQFEPHGQRFSGNDKDVANDLVAKAMKMFVSKVNAKLISLKKPEVQFIHSSHVCPYINGLQGYESSSELIKKIEEGGGYCAAWSMFFTELCLQNPEIPSSSLINYIFDILSSMGEMEKANYLRQVIRGYSAFINQKIDQYFSLFAFSESGLTIKKIKQFSGVEASRFKNIISNLVNIEMNLSTNPFYVENSLEEIQTDLLKLNETLNGKVHIDFNKMSKITELKNEKVTLQLYEQFKNFNSPLSLRSSSRVNQPKKIEEPAPKHMAIKASSPVLPKKRSRALPKAKTIRACPEGKDRNPATGRCKRIQTQKRASKVKVAESCLVGEKKNPATGRCITVSNVKTAKPCLEGKERNPATGRCKNIQTQKRLPPKTPKVKIAKPCLEGKERNPATGRCKSIQTRKRVPREQMKTL
jgi:hypothetical protein